LEFSTEQEPQWRAQPINGQGFSDAFAGAMGSLQAFVEGTASFLPTRIDDAYRTMEVVEAIYRASDQGGELIAWDDLEAD
jgi:hypothetical protein